MRCVAIACSVMWHAVALCCTLCCLSSAVLYSLVTYALKCCLWSSGCNIWQPNPFGVALLRPVGGKVTVALPMLFQLGLAVCRRRCVFCVDSCTFCALPAVHQQHTRMPCVSQCSFPLYSYCSVHWLRQRKAVPCSLCVAGVHECPLLTCTYSNLCCDFV